MSQVETEEMIIRARPLATRRIRDCTMSRPKNIAKWEKDEMEELHETGGVEKDEASGQGAAITPHSLARSLTGE